MPVHRFSISFINHLIVTGLAWLVVLLIVSYSSDAIYFSPAQKGRPMT